MSTAATDQALALAVAERGQALVKLREDQWLDRKSRRISARDLADNLVGFANAEGGSIMVGMWNGQVEGCGPSIGWARRSVAAGGVRPHDAHRRLPDPTRRVREPSR